MKRMSSLFRFSMFLALLLNISPCYSSSESEEDSFSVVAGSPPGSDNLGQDTGDIQQGNDDSLIKGVPIIVVDGNPQQWCYAHENKGTESVQRDNQVATNPHVQQCPAGTSDPTLVEEQMISELFGDCTDVHTIIRTLEQSLGEAVANQAGAQGAAIDYLRARAHIQGMPIDDMTDDEVLGRLRSILQRKSIAQWMMDSAVELIKVEEFIEAVFASNLDPEA